MVNMKQENASCFFDFYGLVLLVYYINHIISKRQLLTPQQRISLQQLNVGGSFCSVGPNPPVLLNTGFYIFFSDSGNLSL